MRDWQVKETRPQRRRKVFSSPYCILGRGLLAGGSGVMNSLYSAVLCHHSRHRLARARWRMDLCTSGIPPHRRARKGTTDGHGQGRPRCLRPGGRWPAGAKSSPADRRAGGPAGGSDYRPGRSRQDNPGHDVPAAGPRPGDVGGPHDRHSCVAASAVRDAGADPAPDPAVDRLSRDGHGQLLRFYARAVTTSAEGRPLLVFVDDAHLLDDGSAMLVHQLSLTGAATVLVTVRTGGPAPDPVVACGRTARPGGSSSARSANRRWRSCWSVLGGPVDAAAARLIADRAGAIRSTCGSW